MKLRGVFLADSVVSREMVLNVLGLGITTLFRTEYPTRFDADIFAIAEIESTDELGNIDFELKVFAVDDPTEESVLGGNGVTYIDKILDPELPAFVTLPFRVAFAEIPHAGLYEVHLTVRDQTETTRFRALQVDTPPSPQGDSQ